MTSKQRAKLRALANKEETILHVGKGGLGETLFMQATEALKARELIKGTVQENSPSGAAEVAAAIAGAAEAEVVQVIGRKFVLYKRNAERPVISLD